MTAEGPTVRARRPHDIPGCVDALAAVHAAGGYPMPWPADAAGWLDFPGRTTVRGQP